MPNHHANQATPPETPEPCSTDDGITAGAEHAGETQAMSPELWRGCLRDQQLMAAVISKPVEWLDQNERAVLSGVSRHFAEPPAASSTNASDPEIDGLSDVEPRRAPPRKRARPSANGTHGRPADRAEPTKRKARDVRNPWRRVLNLKQLSLEPSIARFLAEPTDARDFLSDKDRLVYSLEGDERDCSNTLMVCYEFAQELQRREGVDRIRLLFINLFFHDMMLCIRPEATGKRVGHLMKDDAAELLKNFDGLQVDLDEFRKNVNDWAKCGRKLNHMCQLFGDGCLFYFTEVFTQNFLLNQMPLDGEYVEEAVAHLKKLGIDRLSERSGANAMAVQIRELLIGPFRALASQQHGA
ncbi:hypothetical protein KCU81_g1791, partial [Aureobasidium melanogenum]